jgi:hypothetical protein
MPRYIDADKYIEILRRHKSYFVRELPESMNEAVILGLSMAISEAKGACDDDVVKVVWCEVCKHYDEELGLCFLHTERGHKGEAVCVVACDFCSYGERREQNEG